MSSRGTVRDDTTDLHDTEKCAWWEIPYCERKVEGLDLCGKHGRYAKNHGEQPPVFPRIRTLHFIRNFHPELGIGDCDLCGPRVRATYIKGSTWARCRLGAVAINRAAYFGWSEVDYDLAVIAQGNRCAICSKPPSGKYAILYADHCHVSMRARKLLCLGCNMILGFAVDDPRILEAGAAYLRGIR